jgi:hypothetical protein
LGSLVFAGRCKPRDNFFGMLMGAGGIFVCLPGEFMSVQVVSFAVGGGRCSMSVGSKVMQFSNSIVRALWHCVLLVHLDAGIERSV